MTDLVDTHVYVESLGWVPKESIGPDGQVLPLPPEIGSQIRQIIEEAMERDPRIREIWIAEAERIRAKRRRKGAAA